MFKSIYFSVYGRAVCVRNQWYIAERFGTNRLYYIHKGTAKIQHRDKTVQLKEGHLYLFSQNLEFNPTIDENSFLDHTFFDFFSVPAITAEEEIDIDLKSCPLIDHAAKVLVELAREYPYATVNRTKSGLHYGLVHSYFTNLLCILFERMNIKMARDERIEEALLYIQNNYKNKICIDDLAEICRFEKNYFIRKFKKELGVTPHQYIKKYRVNMAIALLCEGKKVNEVAAQTGYGDITSFSNAIKKELGCSPSAISKTAMAQFYIEG